MGATATAHEDPEREGKLCMPLSQRALCAAHGGICGNWNLELRVDEATRPRVCSVLPDCVRRDAQW